MLWMIISGIAFIYFYLFEGLNGNECLAILYLFQYSEFISEGLGFELWFVWESFQRAGDKCERLSLER